MIEKYPEEIIGNSLQIALKEYFDRLLDSDGNGRYKPYFCFLRVCADHTRRYLAYSLDMRFAHGVSTNDLNNTNLLAWLNFRLNVLDIKIGFLSDDIHTAQFVVDLTP